MNAFWLLPATLGFQACWAPLPGPVMPEAYAVDLADSSSAQVEQEEVEVPVVIENRADEAISIQYEDGGIRLGWNGLFEGNMAGPFYSTHANTGWTCLEPGDRIWRNRVRFATGLTTALSVFVRTEGEAARHLTSNLFHGRGAMRLLIVRGPSGLALEAHHAEPAAVDRHDAARRGEESDEVAKGATITVLAPDGSPVSAGTLWVWEMDAQEDRPSIAWSDFSGWTEFLATHPRATRHALAGEGGVEVQFRTMNVMLLAESEAGSGLAFYTNPRSVSLQLEETMRTPVRLALGAAGDGEGLRILHETRAADSEPWRTIGSARVAGAADAVTIATARSAAGRQHRFRVQGNFGSQSAASHVVTDWKDIPISILVPDFVRPRLTRVGPASTRWTFPLTVVQESAVRDGYGEPLKFDNVTALLLDPHVSDARLNLTLRGLDGRPVARLEQAMDVEIGRLKELACELLPGTTVVSADLTVAADPAPSHVVCELRLADRVLRARAPWPTDGPCHFIISPLSAEPPSFRLSADPEQGFHPSEWIVIRQTAPGEMRASIVLRPRE